MKAFIVFAGIIAVASAAYYTPYGRPYTPTRQPYRTYDADVPILRQSYDASPDGSYSYSYESANGLGAAESGVGGQVVNGEYHYTSPEGVPVQVRYVADENGFQPQGDHLPPQLQRALSYLRSRTFLEKQAYKPTPTYRPYRPLNQYNRYNRF